MERTPAPATGTATSAASGTAAGTASGPAMGFAEIARRVGAAARAAGLVVPAFRTPPRLPSATRTIRRLPAGPVISVRTRARPLADVTRDMIEGVLVANAVGDAAAGRLRAVLLHAARPPTVGDEPGWRNRQTQAA